LTEIMEEPSRALDVGEGKGDGTGRQRAPHNQDAIAVWKREEPVGPAPLFADSTLLEGFP
jgi:hypothetical protein